MYHEFTKKEATADSGGAMECRDHSKNAASPKSLMSRKTFFSTIIVLLTMILVACSQTPEKMKEKALSGDIKSQFCLGELYFSGEEKLGGKDLFLAADWIKKALEQGFDVEKQFGKNEIPAKADMFYQIGYRFAEIFTTDGSEKENLLYWWTEAAKLEQPDAQLALGAIYVMVEEDGDMALYWLEKAAKNFRIDASKRDELNEAINGLKILGYDASKAVINPQLNSKDKESVTFTYNSDTKTLTIKGKGRMTDYGDGVSPPWNQYEDDIQTINIEEGITHIGGQSFWFYENVTSVTIPGTVTSIGDRAFSRTSLTSIIISENVKSIGIGAFHESKISSVYIPASVTNIEPGAFDTHEFTAYTVAENNPVFSAEDGILFDKKKEKIYAYPEKGSSKYIIPNSVKEIATMAFSSNTLTSIRIPSSVRKIDMMAFTCSYLKEVIVEWDNPLVIDGEIKAFFLLLGGLSNCTLKVPRGTKAAYQTANEWKDFGTIIEY